MAADGDIPFASQARSLCTEVANSGLDSDPRMATAVALEARSYPRDSDGPEDGVLNEWKDALDARADFLRSAHERLSELRADDAAEQELWEQVTEANSGELARVDARRDALDAATWAEAHDAVTVADSEGDDPSAALESLGLLRSDCGPVYSAGFVPEDLREFVGAATRTCADIVNRRAEGSFAEDARTVFEAGAAAAQESADFPADLRDALSRVHDEWSTTVDDFASVGDAPQAWDQILETAEDRKGIAQTRLDALDGSESEQIDAFKPGALMTIPGFEFDQLALSFRVCGAVES